MQSNKEYQHFIPQFLLRNYAYPFKCPEAEKSDKKKCKCTHEKGKHPKDLVVNCISLSVAPFSIESRSIKKIFGSPGMYNDPNMPTTIGQRRIETMFSKLESTASQIFRKIVKSHEAGDTAISMTRIERDAIRKFFFLLKYRGSGYHRRFYHESAATYDSNDRERLLDYMTKSGFSSPRDVWYHNIETIINLKMDPENRWIQELPRLMFPADAMWFVTHVGCFYMAICTPSELEEEFILTDNCYNIFEGPNTFIKDEKTGQIHGSNHASFHEFAPISPRLIVILRSDLLPNRLEDQDPKIKQYRQNNYWAVFDQFFGSGCKSLLDDLPIDKARNSYTQVIGDRIIATSEYDGQYRANDKFYFQYYKLGSQHVQIVNNLFLENPGLGKTIAFKSQDAFVRIVESYIGGCSESFKIIGGTDTEERMKYLQGLKSFIQSMGSSTTLLWRPMLDPYHADYQAWREKKLTFDRLMEAPAGSGDGRKVKSTFIELYLKLADNKCRIDEDVAQAGKMVQLQATVYALDFGSTKAIQLELIMTLRIMFQASRCERYWVYLKLWRKSRYGADENTADLIDLVADPAIRDGPEDAFARTAHLYDAATMNHLMYVSVRNDFATRDRPDNIWRKLTEAPRRIEDQFFLQHFMFYQQGIRKIEILAEWEERKLLQTPSPEYLASHTHISDKQRLELAVRIRVRAKFQAAMLGEAGPEELEALEYVFFDLTFPTPPIESYSKPSGHQCASVQLWRRYIVDLAIVEQLCKLASSIFCYLGYRY